MYGTHDSATGEKGRGLVSKLLTPFCRCQSKTLIEQFKAGCRHFDLRIKDEKRGTGIITVFAHGLWTSSKSVSEALEELDGLAGKDDKECYVNITYEGSVNDGLIDEWVMTIQAVMRRYPNLILAAINVKKPKWKNVWKCDNCPSTKIGHINLDGSTWHTYLLPVPWLLDRMYRSLREDEKDKYVLIDFL